MASLTTWRVVVLICVSVVRSAFHPATTSSVISMLRSRRAKALAFSSFTACAVVNFVFVSLSSVLAPWYSQPSARRAAVNMAHT